MQLRDPRVLFFFDLDSLRLTLSDWQASLKAAPLRTKDYLYFNTLSTLCARPTLLLARLNSSPTPSHIPLAIFGFGRSRSRRKTKPSEPKRPCAEVKGEGKQDHTKSRQQLSKARG